VRSLTPSASAASFGLRARRSARGRRPLPSPWESLSSLPDTGLNSLRLPEAGRRLRR
jgi:hypothetical protein